MTKKYCENCKWYENRMKYTMYVFPLIRVCKHPTNHEEKDSWDKVNEYYKWLPQEKNKNNKCPLYQEPTKRSWKFWAKKK